MTLAVALLAGCAGEPVRIPAPVLPVPLIEPLPLRIGLVLAPARRQHVFRDPTLGGNGAEVGEASAAALLAAAQAGFEGVVELEEPRGGAGVDAVLELAAMEWSAAAPAEGLAAVASFDLRLSDPAGAPIGEWSTRQQVGIAEIARDPGETSGLRFRDVYAVPATILLEKVEAAVLREFRDGPAIRPWLEQHSAYRPALSPAAPPGDPAPEAARRPGIAVASDVASDAVRRCVIRRLREQLPGRPILASGELRRALFPWLSDRPPAAIAAERLVALTRYPPARARFAALDLGTVVLVAGGTKQEWHGAGVCGAGFGGGGCLGLEWGKRESVIAAQIIDLSRPDEIRGSESRKSGQAVMPMFGLPLPFIPATQSAACRELGKALALELERPAGIRSDARTLTQ